MTSWIDIQCYEMSIEERPGVVRRSGYHLGTDERLARQIIEERFHGRIAYGLPTMTIALMKGKKMVDCFCGFWTSN